MQYYLILLAFAITVISLIISNAKLTKEKRLNKELMECIACKDEVLEEFRKIRHEYNNMLQTITGFIEEEFWEELKEYNSKLLSKTHLLNRNQLTQLAKIKDKGILIIVYKLFIKTKEMGITLNLTIYNDIEDTSLYSIEFNSILLDYLKQAYELAVKEEVEINLKISSNNMGLRFCIETPISLKTQILASKPIKSNRNSRLSKNIFINSFLQNDHLIQEILISFER